MDKLTNLPCGIGESLREVSLPSIGQRGLKGPLELIAVQFMSSSELQDFRRYSPARGLRRPVRSHRRRHFSFRNDGE